MFLYFQDKVVWRHHRISIFKKDIEQVKRFKVTYHVHTIAFRGINWHNVSPGIEEGVGAG